ncbi:hypothetical protein [Leptospira noguchii]|nr:hypothetical protein [Leptospira noguchii]
MQKRLLYCEQYLSLLFAPIFLRRTHVIYLLQSLKLSGSNII